MTHRHSGVGGLLRDAREARGLELDGVAKALRIRHPYLAAIEEGRFKDLPGGPYASGFVRSYAEFLELDPDEILRRFREESGGGAARTELVFPAPVSEGGFPTAVLILAVIILAAAIYGVWYFYQWRHGGSAEAVSELPERLAALIKPDAEKPTAPNPAQAMAASTTVELPAPSAQFESAKTTPSAPATPPATMTAAAQPATTAATTPPATTPGPVAKMPAPPDLAATAEPAPASAPVVTATPSPAASTPAAPATSQVEPSATAAPSVPAPSPAASSPPTTVVADATPASPNTAAPPAPEITAPARVVLKATDDCWIEIRDADGSVVSARLLHRGDTYPVPPRAGETLTVGNAGAITIVLDGTTLPPVGKTGMVRHDVPIDPDRLTGQAQPATPAAAAPAAAPAQPATSDNE
jgi:cytoskeleton protein RodZ